MAEKTHEHTADPDVVLKGKKNWAEAARKEQSMYRQQQQLNNQWIKQKIQINIHKYRNKYIGCWPVNCAFHLWTCLLTTQPAKWIDLVSCESSILPQCVHVLSARTTTCWFPGIILILVSFTLISMEESRLEMCFQLCKHGYWLMVFKA